MLSYLFANGCNCRRTCLPQYVFASLRAGLVDESARSMPFDAGIIAHSLGNGYRTLCSTGMVRYRSIVPRFGAARGKGGPVTAWFAVDVRDYLSAVVPFERRA